MATKTGNPFLDNDMSELFDVNRIFEQFKVPGGEAQKLFEAQRRNMETVAQANRIAMEGMQAVAQRQSEIVRQCVEEASKAMRDLSQSGSPEERLVKQTELTKYAFELALKNMRELAEMSAKSNSEALEIINKRVSESLDEISMSIKDLSRSKRPAKR